MRDLINLIETDDPRAIFRLGLCDAMAIALHRATHLPLGIWRGFFPDEFGNDDESEAYEDCHAVIVVSFDPPKWIDVDGVHSGEPDNCYFTNPVTRIGLIPATEQEVAEAFSSFDLEEAHVARATAYIANDPRLSRLIAQQK